MARRAAPAGKPMKNNELMLMDNGTPIRDRLREGAAIAVLGGSAYPVTDL
jgi:hypothetical protein